jgi:hypothetical protein
LSSETLQKSCKQRLDVPKNKFGVTVKVAAVEVLNPSNMSRAQGVAEPFEMVQ